MSDSQRWQIAYKTAVRDPRELCRVLELPAEYQEAAVRAAQTFPLFVPRGFLARIRPRDPADPLLLQVLPLHAELSEHPGFTFDPVQDSAAQTRPGLLQKYAGRVLLITTGACAIHCRYCFRRHYPYADAPHALADWLPALQEIAADPTIEEVLLSGGDPLSLVDQRLAELLEQLAAIPHVRRVRWHTRLPIVIPERVTPELIALLRSTRLMNLFVVHCNHSQEIDESVAAALTQLVDQGIPVLNQTVLLRGINDSAAALAALSRRLLDCKVLPYYLHQLDRVAGAAHFEVPVAQGLAIVAQLRTELPGYAVPRYVQEVPGAPSKLPVEYFV
ncbi:MAG: EF-P beta-lysylation protein EpmB [Planctomycetota bacterium]